MATTIETSQRFRITISRGMTGKFSFEATVEMEGEKMHNVLAFSDALVAELEKRYPPEPEKKPTKETAKLPQAEGLGTPEQENTTMGKVQS